MKLSIPENIPLRWELYRGFGWPEVVKTAIVTCAILTLAFLYARLTGSESTPLIIVVSGVISLALCTGIFGKLDGQSIYDWIMRQLVFHREQQIFLYKPNPEVISIVPKTED